MKKVLLVLAIAAVVVACNSKPGTGAANSKISSYADTVGLAQFQAWKVQHELADPNIYYNGGGASSTHTAARKTTRARSSNRTWSRTSESQNAANAPVTAKKKGWSKAAKGAAIGGGSGAILGAIIGKNNRAVGAVIGGVLGAGAGYGIGRHMDKKDGR
jgi:hypothetical protein